MADERDKNRDNIISFEDYRRKLRGTGYREDPLSEVFRKDLREQQDLLDWYLFHRRFSRYKLFVHSLFYENHVVALGHNPNAGFVAVFGEDDIERVIPQLEEALKWAEREYIVVRAAGRTFRELGEPLTGFRPRTAEEAFEAYQRTLLTTDKVVVVAGISKSKFGKKRADIARALVKIIDDAHFQEIRPRADLIFVDHASFLQSSWYELVTYTTIMAG